MFGHFSSFQLDCLYYPFLIDSQQEYFFQIEIKKEVSYWLFFQQNYFNKVFLKEAEKFL